MRCKKCDYALWNLKARTCPECGTAFTPREFEFAVNSVQFCCPHCNQAYYGTSEQGHLVPDSFTCVKCHRWITMDEMVLRPTAGVDEAQTRKSRMPWLERDKRGFIKAWFATVGYAMGLPHLLLRATPEMSSVGQAWGFAAITAAVVSLTIFIPGVCLFSTIGVIAGSSSILVIVSSMFFAAIAVFILFMLSMVLWGAITHLLLWMTGECACGIGRTYQALCYSSGANAISATPCIGMYVGWIWWIVSAVLAVKEAQRVSALYAVISVLVYPILSLLAVFGFIVLSANTVPTGPPTWTLPAPQTRQLANAIVAYGANNGGKGPDHAVQLVVSGHVVPMDFIGSQTSTYEIDVPLADITLDDFQYLPPNRKLMAAQKAADALPANVIAHRVGDFVFTYHGIDLTNADPGLWLVIFSPDPDTNAPSIIVPYAAGADGQAVSIGAIATELAAQNQLRSHYGLSPLPRPNTITHAQPATSP